MSDKPHQDGVAFLTAVQAAIDYGSPEGPVSAADFDRAAEHVSVLLSDSVEAFQRRSFGTCVFLAITAIEETAKAELLGFRLKRPTDARMRGRDPLRDHAQKHLIGVRPTTFMGRLPDLLGDEVCARLQKEATEGRFVPLREQSLYIHAGKDGVTTPATVVTGERAREILLLALEVADDVLVGWTNASYTIGESFDTWIACLS